MAIALEEEGLVVSPAVKFRVQRPTRKAAYDEVQTHGYEVDLVGARADRLVLATVKSFFGSRGVVADHVMGTARGRRQRNLYLLLNDPAIRTGAAPPLSSTAALHPAPSHVRAGRVCGLSAAHTSVRSARKGPSTVAFTAPRGRSPTAARPAE